jgi:hypothetical protein
MQWRNITIKLCTLRRAIVALLWSSTQQHHNASMESDKEKSNIFRREADADAAAYKELWRAEHSRSNIHDESVKSSESSHVQIVKLEAGERLGKIAFWLIPMFIFQMLVIAACGVVMGLNISEQHELIRHFDALDRQSRMTELKLDDWTVVLHRAGLQLPGDYTRGPQGNMDAESFHIKPKEK